MNVYGVDDGGSGDALGDWSESTLTYNNAPWLVQDNNVSNGDDIDVSVTTLLGTFATGGDEGDLKTFTSAGLLSFLQADTNGLATILLSNPNSQSAIDRYMDKEGTATQAPVLTRRGL